MNAVLKIISFIQNFSFVLIVMELLFCFHLPKRKYFWARLLVPALFGILFCREVSPIMPWHEYGQFSKIPFFVIENVLNLGLIIIFIGSIATMKFCFRAPLMKIVALCALGYAAQNLTFQINLIFRHVFFGGDNKNLSYRLISELTIIAVMVGVYFVSRQYKKAADVYVGLWFGIAFTLIMLVIVTSFSYWIYYFDGYSPMLGVFAIISDMFLIVLHYSVLMKTKADKNNALMESMIKKAEWQQEYHKNNIELINRKCHDLKNELAVLRTIGKKSEREQFAAELEKSIMIYDTHIDTGNEALDVVLTEKSLFCESHGIAFSCIADGHALDFMKTVDIAVIFGNAIDNAIEASLKENELNRQISVNVAKVNNMVAINIENYFGGRVEFDSDGNISTTKQDKASHGYGIKSIIYTAKKYEGIVRTVADDNRFKLAILIPDKK